MLQIRKKLDREVKELQQNYAQVGVDIGTYVITIAVYMISFLQIPMK